MTHGPQETLSRGVLSISHPWRRNFRVITSPTTLPRNFCSMRMKRSNGKKCTRKTDLSTSSLPHSPRWDTFHSTTDWSRKDSSDAWICISAPESRRRNLTSTPTPWSPSCQTQKPSNPSPLLWTSFTPVTNTLLAQLQSLLQASIWSPAMSQAFWSSGKRFPPASCSRNSSSNRSSALTGTETIWSSSVTGRFFSLWFGSTRRPWRELGKKSSVRPKQLMVRKSKENGTFMKPPVKSTRKGLGFGGNLKQKWPTQNSRKPKATISWPYALTTSRRTKSSPSTDWARQPHKPTSSTAVPSSRKSLSTPRSPKSSF